MKILVLVIVLFISSIVLSENQPSDSNEFSEVDRIMLEIPKEKTETVSGITEYILSKFDSEQDRLRAAFIWIASNIDYDIANMYMINFEETQDERIEKVLRTRKGVCSGYALLFNKICRGLGFKSYEIQGYTKQKGVLANLSHSWNAVFFDGNWYIFDPTWGAGYNSQGKFVRKINNSYFKAEPTAMIHSHMPFDYLWQFLYYPLTNEEFTKGKSPAEDEKTYFNYPDSLAVYEQQDTLQRLLSSAYRIEKNGVSNAMVFEKLKSVRSEIEYLKDTETISLYNSAVEDNALAVTHMNQYAAYWNNQFKPLKPDEEIQAMLDAAVDKLSSARGKLEQIRYDEGKEKMIKEFKSVLDSNLKQVEEFQQWLDTYFSKSKIQRKSMFYKYNWFGIPLN